MDDGGIAGLGRVMREAAGRGPVALVLVEDGIEVESTLRHHLDLGFARVVAVLPGDLPRPELDAPGLVTLRAETRAPGAGTAIVNAAIAAGPEQWLFYCHNAEYLFFPFSETRGIGDFCAFVTEERRDAVACVTVDLYAPDPAAHPTGVSREAAHLDRMGYAARPRHDAHGRVLERQQVIRGGLRWRFEEHVPEARRDLLRSALFRAAPGLRLGADDRFDREEYDTLECPWHRSPSAAIASFRAAKALRRNPASREAIGSFDWAGAVHFEWRSRQLLDLGLIEPGQWF